MSFTNLKGTFDTVISKGGADVLRNADTFCEGLRQEGINDVDVRTVGLLLEGQGRGKRFGQSDQRGSRVSGQYCRAGNESEYISSPSDPVGSVPCGWCQLPG